MAFAYRHLFPATWMAWAAYWWLSSRGVKPADWIESVSSRLMHVVPLVIAVALLWVPFVPLPFFSDRFFPWSPWQFWTSAGVTAAGLLFTVWARLHLGRNWSGMVTIKADHELVTTGPYAIVRHPIYTGLLLAFIGSAATRADRRAVLAVLIALAALWRKLRLEERWMRERFGADYEAYARRVPALMPFWR